MSNYYEITVNIVDGLLMVNFQDELYLTYWNGTSSIAMS